MIKLTSNLLWITISNLQRFSSSFNLFSPSILISTSQLYTKRFTSNYISSFEDPQLDFINFLKKSSKINLDLSNVVNLHSRAIKCGFIQNQQVGNGLLILYAKCNCLDIAYKLFDRFTIRDVFSWTVLISSYSRLGKPEIGLCIFSHMITCGSFPNCFTLSTVLKCCIKMNDLKMGKEIHAWMKRNCVEMDVVLENTMIEFYAKCGAFRYAKNVFETMSDRNVISWNIMIAAYIEIDDINGSVELFRASPIKDVSSWNTIVNGQMQKGFDLLALRLLREMVSARIIFSAFTYSIALSLASKLTRSELGRQIHNQVVICGYEDDLFIKNSLMDMYSKCGKLEVSLAVFNNSSNSNCGPTDKTIQWSSMIAGFVQNGRVKEAIIMFIKMLQEGIKINKFTLTSISSTCSDAENIVQGRQIHAFVLKLGLEYDPYIGSSFTDMYSKCGDLDDACKVFYSTNSKDSVIWTSMISSYASHGYASEAIQLYEKMITEKITPNKVTFVSVLYACSHRGLINDGYKYFKSMQEEYKIVPSIEHYNCMVDLLGRAGRIEEAKEFIFDNNLSNYIVVWKSLISACRVHNNMEMAVWASEQLFHLKPQDVGSYVQMSNIYATKMNFLEANNLRSLMKEKEMNKQPGQSWIYIENGVHVFVVGDMSHPMIKAIHLCLEHLTESLKESEYLYKFALEEEEAAAA